MTLTTTNDQDIRRKRTVVWVVTLATLGLMFDGYDLVVYGAVLPTFLKDPSQIGEVTPAVAGTLGSYALLGMLFGALIAGAVGDIVGRRRVMLTAYAWFSIGMAITALTSITTTFGVMRFITGLGIGALIATTGALVAEIAPPGKKNLCSAISYSGVPLGSLLGSFLAIVLLDSIGWRGMFMIGALPTLTLLPLAYFKLPESVSWLVAKGQIDRAWVISERTGVPVPDSVPQSAKAEKVGFAGLFSRGFLFATVITGLMSALAQCLNYFLNTWLPVLMEQAGFNAKGSLAFLLVLSGGAILGALASSRFADRFGPKPVVAICFLIGAVFIALLTLDLPLPVRLLLVAIVGLGTTGTSILIYGLVANHFPTKMRGAAVAWAAGFGRLGGISGPLVGGLVLAAGLSVSSIFYILTGLALVGVILTLLVPHAHRETDIHSTPVEPTVPVGTGTSAGFPTT
jgi:AAHS family benzoate transporter-like MFS transporter